MIGFLDVNTLWRRKFAEALRKRVTGTLLFAPHAMGQTALAEPDDVAIALPPGWAGPTSMLAMPLLHYRIDRLARTCGGTIDTLVLTTPHYWPLVRRAGSIRQIIYYCSDDYRSYHGWDATRMARDEAQLCRRATLSIFVSEALRARAVDEYALDANKTIVSPNATEPRFAEPRAIPAEAVGLPGPVFGVAGVFGARIDTAFLAAIADDPRVGTLALVGPIDASLAGDAALARLRGNPRVRFFGAQPHARMPDWMAAFDVAIIPYAPTVFNRFCSPMRLYDHRAIGQPIVATPYCAQIADYSDVLVGEQADVPRLVGQALATLANGRVPRIETWDMRIDALRKSAIAAILVSQ